MIGERSYDSDKVGDLNCVAFFAVDLVGIDDLHVASASDKCSLAELLAHNPYPRLLWPDLIRSDAHGVVANEDRVSDFRPNVIRESHGGRHTRPVLHIQL